MDIRTFLKTLHRSLQPVAKGKSIKLDFTAEKDVKELDCSECELNDGFVKLISSIIEYVPAKNTIYLNVGNIENDGAKYVSFKIRNTGINLKVMTAITRKSQLPVGLFSSAVNETTFEVRYNLDSSLNMPVVKNGSVLNYTLFIKGIQNQFRWLNNHMAWLSESKPKEAAFLTKVNNCILKNIDDDRFDANALSAGMAMSRAQLLRRLKSLTGNSPGFYIKTLRLEKAKELLLTSTLSVSETAFKTGFASLSNFTKVFSERYGMTPSQFRRINSGATNG